MANKLYEVIRKHPNPDSAHDITIGGIKYKKGDKVGFNIFLKDNNGSKKHAEEAISLAKKRKWIKDLGNDSGNEEKELVDMTKKELIEYAEKNNIIVDDTANKKEILESITSPDDSDDSGNEEGSEE